MGRYQRGNVCQRKQNKWLQYQWEEEGKGLKSVDDSCGCVGISMNISMYWVALHGNFPFELPVFLASLSSSLKWLKCIQLWTTFQATCHSMQESRNHFPMLELLSNENFICNDFLRSKMKKTFSVVILSCFPHVRICGCIFSSRVRTFLCRSENKRNS